MWALSVGLLVMPSLSGYGQSSPLQIPKTILLDGTMLALVRQEKDRTIIEEAIREAQKPLQDEPQSVVRKQVLPPSGDKHDYLSLAPYSWPNPNTSNHLPYINRDGEVNPEVKLVPDSENLSAMCGDVRALAAAYYLTRDERYADKAATLLRIWFLDPATRMNPNMNFAQGERGRADGNPWGVLEGMPLKLVVDGLALLVGSTSWTANDDAAMHSWFAAYFHWLTSSDLGRREGTASNNHGSWYDVQASAIAIYLGRDDAARKLIGIGGKTHIAQQILKDGEQPLELKRTKPSMYSRYNLAALTELATIGQVVGVDLWHYKGAQGGTIRSALDYLFSFAQNPGAWRFKDLQPYSVGGLRTPLLMAAVEYHSREYEDAAMAIPGPLGLQELLLIKAYKTSNTKE